MGRRKTAVFCFLGLGIGVCAATGAQPTSVSSRPPAATGPSNAPAAQQDAATRNAAGAGNPASTLYCKSGAAPPQVCRMEIKTEPGEAAMTLVFTFDSGSVRFKGQHQSAWWSGRLNDKPAMGYELNRGHTIYSTSDLSTTFEWWYGDMQHGNY